MGERRHLVTRPANEPRTECLPQSLPTPVPPACTVGRALVALALTLAWALTGGARPVAAQGGARVEGVVLDESGGVLPGVTVTVTPEVSTTEPLVQVSDSEGAFVLLF